MPTLDDEIARHLEQARRTGELQAAPGFGQPLAEDEGWEATPDALRMPFKILKRAGVVPAEVELMQQRSRLRARVADTSLPAAERESLQQQLSALEQGIALRMEALRRNAAT